MHHALQPDATYGGQYLLAAEVIFLPKYFCLPLLYFKKVLFHISSDCLFAPQQVYQIIPSSFCVLILE